jgi:uncharacterized membrane protein
VLLGTAGAVSAAGLGWLDASFNGYDAGQLLTLHRWLGTGAAACAVAVALLSEMDARRGVRSVRFRVLLLVGALLVGLAGHFGGALVYGPDYFNW